MNLPQQAPRAGRVSRYRPEDSFALISIFQNTQ